MNRLIEVKYQGEKAYNIDIRPDFFSLKSDLEAEGICNSNKKVCIISDSNVAKNYINEIRDILNGCFGFVTEYVFEAGEPSKKLSTIEKIYEHLIINKFDRKDILLALGGGVVGDMTGFAAATYLRGIDFVQVPTSLLAQVDSSIGGKTGVDLNAYKNMVGAFHQPKLVYMNIGAFKTLDEEQFACGMAEEIKHGLIKDKDLYQSIKSNADLIKQKNVDILMDMLDKGCNIKRVVVENDPTEKGERALLNFGHTIGHAVEKMSDFSLYHGQCVALGTVAAAYISVKKGKISQADLKDIEDTLVKFDLPIRVDKSFKATAEEILAATKSDKKMVSGQIKFTLLNSIGDAYSDMTVTDDEMMESIRYIMNN